MTLGLGFAVQKEPLLISIDPITNRKSFCARLFGRSIAIENVIARRIADPKCSQCSKPENLENGYEMMALYMPPGPASRVFTLLNLEVELTGQDGTFYSRSEFKIGKKFNACGNPCYYLNALELFEFRSVLIKKFKPLVLPSLIQVRGLPLATA